MKILLITAGLILVLWHTCCVLPAFAQVSAFTYQGKLADGGTPAAGTYDMQFKLFDTPAVGTGIQQGGTVANPTVPVSNGIFTVSLDFGSAVFAAGADRYLEISVRPGGSAGSYTVLDPRQRLTSTPYAIRAINAAQLDGAPASDYVRTTAAIVNAATHYSINGQRILADAGTNNLFAGVNAGTSTSTGSANAFFGKNAGAANSTGGSNSFFGYNSGAATTTGRNNTFAGDAAGFNNTTADNNTFVGFLSGFLNSTGTGNAFYGSAAGQNNVIGSSNSFFGFVAGLNNLASDNSFFGRGAGFTNTSGARNAFFGRNASDFNSNGNDNSSFGFNAGKSNTTGNRSVFFGSAAGFSNTTGSNVTAIGAAADVSQNNLQYATAIGSNAVVGANDTIVLGKAAGTYNSVVRPADTVRIPGDLEVTGTFEASQFSVAGTNILTANGPYDDGGGTTFAASNTFVGETAGTNTTPDAVLNSSYGKFNSFVGANAGKANTIGYSNSFFGTNAGQSNTTGNANSFFGYNTGRLNTTGGSNAVFGADAGVNNSTGGNNAFYGRYSGNANTTGSDNSFFGHDSGFGTNSGAGNSFFGRRAGVANTTGFNNSFVGASAGSNHTTGSYNTLIGWQAGVFTTTGTHNSFFGTSSGTGNIAGIANTTLGYRANTMTNSLQNATAVGAYAAVAQSNSVVLGGINGTNGATSDTTVGIGTASPAARLHIKANTGNMLLGDSGCGIQFNGFGFGTSLTCNNYSMLGEGSSTWINRAPGGYIYFREGNSDQVIIKPGGVVYLGSLGAAGTPQATLCRNTSSEIAFCSSSRRYKTAIESYSDGMSIISRLRPVNFKWLTGGQQDMGLIAEEVAEVEPLLAFRNNEGIIEGVSYPQLSVVLVNAAKEHQKQIEELREQNKSLLVRVDALKRLVCRGNETAELCREP